MKDLKAICEEVIRISKEAGAFIQNERVSFQLDAIEIKGRNDFVSYVDKSSEKMIVEALEKLIPEAGFITEEQTRNTKAERYNWIIDPLDGTTNFIHGLPFYCTSIALMENDEVVLGVVYEINRDECFYSWKGEMAYVNGKEIQVSRISRLNDALVLTGFPYTDFSKMKEYMDFFQHLMRNTHGLRRPGSAAADLAYIAAGRSDAFYEYGLSPWDVAAGAFLVKQAGGKVSDFSGGDNYIFGKEIITTGPGIAEEFLSELNKFF